MRRALAPDLVFDGARLHQGAGLVIEDGYVAALTARPEAGARPVPGLLTPGLVDLQVNGGGGVLFNTDPTPEGLARIVAAHRGLGTAAILPTVITDTTKVMEHAAEAALTRVPGTLGIHIEGPHISVPRRGTHAARYVRPMEPATLALVERLRADSLPVMITVAPEVVTAEEIGRLARTGAVVSIGHSDATSGQVKAALAAGASCFTHLFNAMSPMLNRAPGVTGAAINSGAACGIICDGIHVADEMVGLALRARPVADAMFLVSDAMPTVGGPDRFDLYGQELRLSDGRLINAEGSLAGAHVTQAEGVARLVNHVGIGLEAALRMALTVPALLIGRPDLARIEGRPVGDLVQFGPDLRFLGALPDPVAAT